MKPVRAICGLLVLVLALTLAGAQLSCYANQRDEESMGREYSADVEKQARLVTDPAVVARVERIGQMLAKIANEDVVRASYGTSDIYKFNYHFKVIEDKDVNAFCLPGGYIYVNSGLMDLVQSDDELAGVIAHEIAHAAHHHMSALLKKNSTVDRTVALVALAGILGKLRSTDLQNLLMGAQMLKIGKMSSYTMEAERDADRTAVAYMAKSQFNPEGLLTFMKKLDQKHDENPTLSLGIFQDHPAPFRRVSAITKEMVAQGIKVDMRRLRDVAYAKPEPVKEGSEMYQVVISKRVIYEPASVNGATSKARAELIAKTINSALDAGITPKDISQGEQCILARGQEIIKVENEDAKLSHEETQQLVTKARSVLQYAVWADWLTTSCPNAQDTSGDE